MVDGGGGDGSPTGAPGMTMQVQRHLKAVLRCCERGRDVLAWRMRCRRESVPVSPVEEASKTLVVLTGLMRLGLCREEDLDLIADAVLLSEGLEDLGAWMERVLVMLRGRVEALAAPVVPGARGSKSVVIARAVVESFLPVVARLMLEAALARRLDRVMGACAGWPVMPSVAARSEEVDSTDGLLRVGVPPDLEQAAPVALAAAEAALAAARKAVVDRRRDVRKVTARIHSAKVDARKAALRASKRRQTQGADQFDPAG